MLRFVEENIMLRKLYRFSLNNFGCTVELQWLEHLRDYENMLETGVVRFNEC